MAYIQPMVMVYQEYSSTSNSTATADLIPCIIGPCYHIIDAVDDSDLSSIGHFYGYTRTESVVNNMGVTTSVSVPIGLNNKTIPNNKAGAEIVWDEVTITCLNARVCIINTLAYDPDEISGNVFTCTDAIPTFVTVGDIVAVYTASLTTEYRITSIDRDAKKIYVHKSITAIPEDDDTIVQVWREVSEITIPNSSITSFDKTHNTLTLTAYNYSFEEGEVSEYVSGVLTDKKCQLMSADCYVSYKALRTDLSDISTLYSVDEISGTLGKITPENPLAFGVNVCLTNTTTSVKCIGIESNDLVGYTSAKDRLESVDDVYALVPLTTEVSVLTMFKNHCVELSEPEESRWRVALGSCDLVKEEQRGAGFGKLYYSTFVDGDNVTWYECTLYNDELTTSAIKAKRAAGYTINDSNLFVSNSIKAGDKLTLTTDSNTTQVFTVESVPAEDMIVFTVKDSELTLSNFSAKETGSTTVPASRYYTIEHYLDKTEQAQAISDVSSSYGDKRYVNVWPNICTVDEYDNLPGYYLCCAVAGGIGGLAPHYGFTNLSMSGISAVQNSNDYFNKEQLNIIADGGTFIFVQENPSAAPYVRHQLTTDRSTIEFQELSFTKNFDYVSYICKDTLAPFIGKWNVVSETLNSIRIALSAVLEQLKLNSLPKIGSPILGYSITSISQLEDSKDRVEVYVDVQFPYPLNTIGLHIVSQ